MISSQSGYQEQCNYIIKNQTPNRMILIFLSLDPWARRARVLMSYLDPLV